MKLDPNKTALLVIDMQGGFIDEASPTCIPAARGTIPACAAVQAKARELGVPVVFIIRKYAADVSRLAAGRKALQYGGRAAGMGAGV